MTTIREVCEKAPLFTVFTATFNRAHTLHRVYDSLRAQTLQNFEWLLIDDGSTDGTRELVESWATVAPFPVRYIWQPNSGKHVAYNRALAEAQAPFFTLLDSDDACEPNALERLAAHWQSIPAEQQEAFSGVGCLCRDQYGAIVGERFPTEPFDANVREVYYLHRIHGEKWGMQRTEVLKRFPFPALAGTKFIPEAVVWNAISKTYRLRWVNDALRVYFIGSEDAGETLSRQGLRDNAPGKLYYCAWLLNNDLEYFGRSPMPFLKAAVLLPIVSAASGSTFATQWRALKSWNARLLVLLTCPLAALIGCVDRIKRVAR